MGTFSSSPFLATSPPFTPLQPHAPLSCVPWQPHMLGRTITARRPQTRAMRVHRVRIRIRAGQGKVGRGVDFLKLGDPTQSLSLAADAELTPGRRQQGGRAANEGATAGEGRERQRRGAISEAMSRAAVLGAACCVALTLIQGQPVVSISFPHAATPNADVAVEIGEGTGRSLNIRDERVIMEKGREGVQVARYGSAAVSLRWDAPTAQAALIMGSLDKVKAAEKSVEQVMATVKNSKNLEKVITVVTGPLVTPDLVDSQLRAVLEAEAEGDGAAVSWDRLAESVGHLVDSFTSLTSQFELLAEGEAALAVVKGFLEGVASRLMAFELSAVAGQAQRFLIFTPLLAAAMWWNMRKQDFAFLSSSPSQIPAGQQPPPAAVSSFAGSHGGSVGAGGRGGGGGGGVGPPGSGRVDGRVDALRGVRRVQQGERVRRELRRLQLKREVREELQALGKNALPPTASLPSSPPSVAAECKELEDLLSQLASLAPCEGEQASKDWGIRGDWLLSYVSPSLLPALSLPSLALPTATATAPSTSSSSPSPSLLSSLPQLPPVQLLWLLAELPGVEVGRVRQRITRAEAGVSEVAASAEEADIGGNEARVSSDDYWVLERLEMKEEVQLRVNQLGSIAFTFFSPPTRKPHAGLLSYPSSFSLQPTELMGRDMSQAQLPPLSLPSPSEAQRMLRSFVAALPRPDGGTSGSRDARVSDSGKDKSVMGTMAGNSGERRSETSTESSNRWATVYLDDDFRIDQNAAGQFLLFIRESV